MTVRRSLGLLPQQQLFRKQARARRVARHGVCADLRHQVRLGAKQRSADENADRRIGGGGAPALDGATKRLETHFRAQGEAENGEPVAGDEIDDVIGLRVLAQLHVPMGVAHETGDHIHAEHMALAAHGAKRRALPAVVDAGFLVAAEDAQQLLQPGDADRHFDEAAAILFPQCAEITRGFGHEAEEERLLGVTARTHAVEKFIRGRAVVFDQEPSEFGDLLPGESAFRFLRGKFVMEHLQAGNDVFENDRGEPFLIRGARTTREHLCKLFATRVRDELCVPTAAHSGLPTLARRREPSPFTRDADCWLARPSDYDNPQFFDSARRSNAVGAAFSPAFFLVYLMVIQMARGVAKRFLLK